MRIHAYIYILSTFKDYDVFSLLISLKLVTLGNIKLFIN